MDKLAAYEMLLADHPLWDKEARARPVGSSAADTYKRGKDIAARIFGARTPVEAGTARRQATAFALKNPKYSRLVNPNPDKMGRHTYGPMLDDLYPRN